MANRIEDMTLKELSERVDGQVRQEDKEYEDHRIRCPKPTVVYICPTEGCGNYYASPDFNPRDPALHYLQSRRTQKGGYEQTHSRVECPSCRSHGRSVDRIPYLVLEVIPYDQL